MGWQLRRGALTGTLLHNAGTALCACFDSECDCDPDVPSIVSFSFTAGAGLPERALAAEGSYTAIWYTSCRWRNLGYVVGGEYNVVVDLGVSGGIAGSLWNMYVKIYYDGPSGRSDIYVGPSSAQTMGGPCDPSGTWTDSVTSRGTIVISI